jgi:biotin carboxylase
MKILVLGTGGAQADLIEYLRSTECEVYGLSYRKEGPGLEHVNHFELINITDGETVKKFAKRNNIELIYSVGSDYALPSIAYASKQLNLPCFFTDRHAALANDKYALRTFLRNNHLITLEFMQVEEPRDLENWDMFPAIIKPIDSQGQRGVFQVNDKRELESCFRNVLVHSKGKKAIIEEYVNGKEVSVNAYVKEGRLLYLFISERHVVERMRGGIIKDHVLPASVSNKTYSKIKNLVEETINRIELTNGPAYFQIKHADNDIHMIEFTPRLDGCHLWRLIDCVFGINLLRMTIDHLLGHPLEIQELDVGQKHKLEFFLREPGEIFSSDYWGRDTKSLFRYFYYQEGEKVRPVNGMLEKVGYHIVGM